MSFISSAVTHAEPFGAMAGPFTSANALEAGLTRHVLADLVRDGDLRRVLRDVYVGTRRPDTLELRAAAASLVVSEHAVMVDRTAAWFWGVDAFDKASDVVVRPLETFVLRGKARVRRREASGGERDLASSDIVRIGGVAVTTPVRTALDLACNLSQFSAMAALDGLAREQGINVLDLQLGLKRFRRRRGVVQARRLVPLMDARAESQGESITRLVIHDSGLPMPEPQFWVLHDGYPRYRLDLAYPNHRVCVEYDGVEFHASPEMREGDRLRREWLRDHGWIVIVVTKDSFKRLALDAWIGELGDALHERRLNAA